MRSVYMRTSLVALEGGRRFNNDTEPTKLVPLRPDLIACVCTVSCLRLRLLPIIGLDTST
jgi:hypothetical protein